MKSPAVPLPLQALSKMTKRKNSPQKKLQEVATANELIKNGLSNIAESEFKILVIKLIAGLEKSIEDSRESIATEIKGLRNSHEELKMLQMRCKIKWRRPQLTLKRQRREWVN